MYRSARTSPGATANFRSRHSPKAVPAIAVGRSTPYRALNPTTTRPRPSPRSTFWRLVAQPLTTPPLRQVFAVTAAGRHPPAAVTRLIGYLSDAGRELDRA